LCVLPPWMVLLLLFVAVAVLVMAVVAALPL
jgi:hypothetical protein